MTEGVSFHKALKQLISLDERVWLTANNNLNSSRRVGKATSPATLYHTHSMELVMKGQNNNITMDDPER